jgi:hypothetical protein
MVVDVSDRGGVVRAVLMIAALAGCNGGKSGGPRPGPHEEDADAGVAVVADAIAPRSPDLSAERADAALDLAAPAPTPDAGADAPANTGVADAPSQRCNGHEALCDRRLDQVVFPATHNAMSNAEDGFLAPNQSHNIKRQLEDGIRALLIDTHSWRGGSYLCHSICEFGNRPLVDGLRDIATFLRGHPDEVVVLIIEDGVSAADTEKAFKDSTLIDFVYVHDGAAAAAHWPTLRQMIASGKRLVVTAENGGPPPAWYHHVWDLAWDTPYTFKSKSDFSCAQNRGDRSHDLFLLNHWLENPLATEGQSATANARDVLLGRARQCQMESGKLPNFVAVNHYSIGALFEVVRILNGL